MSEQTPNNEVAPQFDRDEQYLPPARKKGFKLLRNVLIYHLSLLFVLLMTAAIFPGFMEYMPIGGVTELAEGVELDVSAFSESEDDAYDGEIVSSIIQATNSFDRLGYARELLIVLVGVWLLVLPVSWVHKGIHEVSSHDRSLDETVLILPGIVATIVMVVQHSLALAFSLAGIVAGVQFRRALQDTFDALFILVAIGTGLSAGVGALEISTVMTIFFCYSTLYIFYTGDGLEAHHEARRKVLKDRRKSEGKKTGGQRDSDQPE
jgi:hypothetical protein